MPSAPPGGERAWLRQHHLSFGLPLRAELGARASHARLPGGVHRPESRRPPAAHGGRRGSERGWPSWTLTDAPSAPAALRTTPLAPPRPASRALAFPRPPGCRRAGGGGRRPGPGSDPARGRRRRARSGGRRKEEELPARARGGARGRAAERSEFAPEPAAAGPHLGRPPPRRPRRPRGDVGCWRAPGSSGGGGSCNSNSSPGGGRLSSGR